MGLTQMHTTTSGAVLDSTMGLLRITPALYSNIKLLFLQLVAQCSSLLQMHRFGLTCSMSSSLAHCTISTSSSMTSAPPLYRASTLLTAPHASHGLWHCPAPRLSSPLLQQWAIKGKQRYRYKARWNTNTIGQIIYTCTKDHNGVMPPMRDIPIHRHEMSMDIRLLQEQLTGLTWNLLMTVEDGMCCGDRCRWETEGNSKRPREGCEPAMPQDWMKNGGW